jgi:hypothetical protein
MGGNQQKGEFNVTPLPAVGLTKVKVDLNLPDAPDRPLKPGSTSRNAAEGA